MVATPMEIQRSLQVSAAAAAAHTAAVAVKAAAGAARAAGLVTQSSAPVAAAKTVNTLAGLMEQHGVDPRVFPRLAALVPCLQAQLQAADQGRPAHSSSGLVHPDLHVISTAAKHEFGEDVVENFGALTPRLARRRQRGRRKTGALARSAGSCADDARGGRPCLQGCADAKHPASSTGAGSTGSEGDLCDTFFYGDVFTNAATQTDAVPCATCETLELKNSFRETKIIGLTDPDVIVDVTDSKPAPCDEVSVLNTADAAAGCPSTETERFGIVGTPDTSATSSRLKTGKGTSSSCSLPSADVTAASSGLPESYWAQLASSRELSFILSVACPCILNAWSDAEGSPDGHEAALRWLLTELVGSHGHCKLASCSCQPIS